MWQSFWKARPWSVEKPIAASLALLLMPPPAVAIKAYPVWGWNLSTRVTISIPPSPDNQQVCWSYDSGEVYSSSCWTLTANSPRTTTKIVEHLPQGIYVVGVELFRSDGTRSVATTKVCSFGPDISMESCNPSIE